MIHPTRRALDVVLAGVLVAVTSSTAWAVDGVVLIDQNRALAGNVTPGDAPGFPITISVSGSYRLASNLTVPNENTTAIDVTTAAGSVAIDLNGFTIHGPTVCDTSIPPVCSPVAADPSNIFGSGDGIRSGASESLTVRNGAIAGMGRYAVFSFNAPTVLIDSVQVRFSGLGGLFLGGGTVSNSLLTRNGGNAIALNQGIVINNIITRTAGDGVISTGFPVNAIDNQIGQSGGVGINFAASGAYKGNLLFSNFGGNVSGSGLQTGTNACNGAPCP